MNAVVATFPKSDRRSGTRCRLTRKTEFKESASGPPAWLRCFETLLRCQYQTAAVSTLPSTAAKAFYAPTLQSQITLHFALGLPRTPGQHHAWEGTMRTI